MQVEMDKIFTPKNAIATSIIVGVLILGYFINWSHLVNITATITELDSYSETSYKKTSSGKTRRSTTHKNIIVTDKGIFEDKTDLLRGKFGSSFYYKLDEGDTYDFTIAGFSIPFIRSYPNIISIKEVSSNNEE